MAMRRSNPKTRVTNWGDFGELDECNSLTFAVGFITKLESRQGSDDDTAMNAIVLECCSPCLFFLMSSKFEVLNLFYHLNNF